MKFTSILIFTLFSISIFTQNIGINATGVAPDNSALLDISSTDKGILIPRVNIIDLNTAAPVTTPTNSLMVFNTNITSGVGYYFWDGLKWVRVLDSNSNVDEDWHEASTNNAPNDINDNIFTNGNVGIGLNNPSQAIDIFNGNIEFDTEYGIGRNHGSTTSEWVIRPYRTGFNALNVFGSVAPFDVGMSLESDALIAFIETDNENLIGWLDVNSKEFIWDGKIGIGIEDPSAQLTIKGDARIRMDNNINYQWDINIHNTNSSFTIAELINNTSSRTRFNIDSTGKVSVGLTNPTARFEVLHNVGNEYAARIKTNRGVNGHGLIIESNGGDSDDTLLYVRGDLDAILPSVPKENFIVLGDGRTGIAHTNPNTLTKLDVNGYMIGQNFFFNAFSTTEVANFSDGSISFTEQNDPNNNYAAGVYTAPVSGFYFITTNIVFDGGDGVDDTMNFRFLKNGSTGVNSLVINPRFSSEEGKESNISHSTIIQLNTGETVEVQITGVTTGNPVDYGRRNFMGYLISK